MLHEHLRVAPLGPRVLSIQYCELGAAGPRPLQFLATVNVPTIVNATFQQHILCRIRPPDHIHIYLSGTGKDPSLGT